MATSSAFIEARMYRPHQIPANELPNTSHGTSESIRHPDDVDLNSRLETATLSMREGMRPTNTAKAMDPKIEEYFQFCDHVYGADPYLLSSSFF